MMQRKDISAAQQRIIREEYAAGKGLRAIGDKLNHSVGIIRRELLAQGIEIRVVGRPKKAV